jgi:hypothetical protein
MRQCDSHARVSGDAPISSVRTACSPPPPAWLAKSTALQELRRAQPNISLDWIAHHMPIKESPEREHYLEGFRRAGLD